MGEPAGAAMAHSTVYMGNQSLVFVMAEGSASSLSKASPPQHGVEHDRNSYRSHCVRQSRTKVQGQNHKSPHRTSLEKDLVAHSAFLYQSKICERSKTSEKKLGAKRLISGDWSGNPKGVNPPSVNSTSVQGAANYSTRSMKETVLI